MAGLVDEFGQITPEGLVQLLAVQQQSITQAIEQRFQQFAQPMEAQREEQAYNAGLESAKDMLGDNVARFGEFAADPAGRRDRPRPCPRPGRRAPVGSDPSRPVRPTPSGRRDRDSAGRRGGADVPQQRQGPGRRAGSEPSLTLANAAAEPGNGATGGIAGVPEFNSPREVVEFYAAQARQLDQAGGGAAA
jgi:hypothetical protein